MHSYRIYSLVRTFIDYVYHMIVDYISCTVLIKQFIF